MLKGTDIWIDEDFPKKVQEERKVLIQQMKEARKKGYRTQLRYNKLIINGTVYEAKDLLSNEQENSTDEDTNNERKRKMHERSPNSQVTESQLKRVNTEPNPKN